MKELRIDNTVTFNIEKKRKNVIKLLFLYIFYIISACGLNNFKIFIIPFNIILDFCFKLIPILGILIITDIFLFFNYKSKIYNKKKIKNFDLIIFILIILDLFLFYLLFFNPNLYFIFTFNFSNVGSIINNSIIYLFSNPHFLLYVINGFLFIFTSIYLILSISIKKRRNKIVLSYFLATSIYVTIINFFQIFEIYSQFILIISFFIISWQFFLIKKSSIFLNYNVIELKNHAFRSFALIFNKGSYRRGIAILEVTQISKNMITRENRDKPRTIDKLITSGQKQYLFYHLLPLADEIQQLSYEIAISKYQVKLRFYISQSGNLIEEELINKLREKSDFIEAAFKSSFKDIAFKNLIGEELIDAWGEILEYGNYTFKRIGNNIIEIDRTTNNLYISILFLDSIAPIKADLTLTQIDELINNILSHNINAHYISIIEPSSKYDFSKYSEQNSQPSDLNYQNPKILDNIGLENKIHNRLLKVRHSEYIQIWNCSIYIVIKAMDPELLKRDIQKIKAIFKNVFSNSTNTGIIKILEKKELENALPKIIMRDKINSIKMSSEQLISTFHLPESTFPSISISRDIPVFEIPPKLENIDKRKIKIGTIMHGDRLLYDTYIDLEELRLNMFIVGQVGMGKTEFTKNFLAELYNADSNVNWIVLEWKGDYKDLITRIKEPIQIIKAGSEQNPLKINFFDPLRANPENHAMKLFSIFKEVFKSSYKSASNLANYELSPQMEKITRDILIECIRNPQKRNFKAFFYELQNYESSHYENRSSSISMSISAIENRFQRFISGVLGKILNTEKSNINFQELMNRKIIFDLSNIIYEEGTKEDVRLLINIILKYVIDQALKRGPTNELKHIVILEDSQLLVPEILREVPETTLGEDIPLLLRSVGEAMITIATRPQISPDIISNSAIKVTFKLNQADDTLKVAKYQNLSDDQEKYLKLIKKQEAIVTTLNFSYPFRIKTINSYPKPTSDEEIISHNKKNFPEMYQDEDENKIVKESESQLESPNILTSNIEASKIINKEKTNKLLSDWENKCFQNLTDEYKNLYLELKNILIQPKTKKEISKQININEEGLEKFLIKFESLKLVSYDFFPNFNSEISIKRYFLNDNINYLQKMIEKKLKEDFYDSGAIGDSDIEFFDYFIFKNDLYIKIFTNQINDTNKNYYKELFIQWQNEILKNKKIGLIIIVPFSSSINIIELIVNGNLKIPVKTFAFNYVFWEKLKEIITQNIIPGENQSKEGISKEINEFLEDLQELNSNIISDKFPFLNNNNKNGNETKNNPNLDKNKINEIFTFIDKFQKKVKSD